MKSSNSHVKTLWTQQRQRYAGPIAASLMAAAAITLATGCGSTADTSTEDNPQASTSVTPSSPDEQQLETLVTDVVTAFGKQDKANLNKTTCGQLNQLVANNIFDPLASSDTVNTLWSGKVLRVEDLHYSSVYEDLGTVYGELIYERKVDQSMPWPVARFSLSENDGTWQVCSVVATI